MLRRLVSNPYSAFLRNIGNKCILIAVHTAGFDEVPRAILSIPARHDLCRRVDASFLAGLVCEHIPDMSEVEEKIIDPACNLDRETYRME